MKEEGVFELPSQYLFVFVIAGICLSIMFFSSYQIWKEQQFKEALREINKIVKEAELMYATAEENSIIKMPVSFPSTFDEAIFGSYDVNKTNHYYFRMKWGKGISAFSKANFTGRKDRVDIAKIYGECSEISLSIVKIDGGKYVCILPL